jgi:hypothetical protein
LLPVVFQEHGQADQIPERHPEHAGQFGKHVDTRRLAPTGLRFGQPVGATTDESGQYLLRVATALPMERDPFADTQVISETTHACCLLRCRGVLHDSDAATTRTGRRRLGPAQELLGSG